MCPRTPAHLTAARVPCIVEGHPARLDLDHDPSSRGRRQAPPLGVAGRGAAGTAASDRSEGDSAEDSAAASEDSAAAAAVVLAGSAAGGAAAEGRAGAGVTHITRKG